MDIDDYRNLTGQHEGPVFGEPRTQRSAAVSAEIRRIANMFPLYQQLGRIFVQVLMFAMANLAHLPFIGAGPVGNQVTNPDAGNNIGITDPSGAFVFGLVALWNMRQTVVITPQGNKFWAHKHTPTVIKDYLKYAFDRVYDEFTLFHVAYDSVRVVITGDDDITEDDPDSFDPALVVFFYNFVFGFLTDTPELADQIVLEWARSCTGMIPCIMALQYKLSISLQVVMMRHMPDFFRDENGRIPRLWWNKIDEHYETMILLMLERYIKTKYPELHTFYHPDESVTEEACQHYEWTHGVDLVFDSGLRPDARFNDIAVWVHDPTGYPVLPTDVIPGTLPADVRQPRDMNRFVSMMTGGINHTHLQTCEESLQAYMKLWNTPGQEDGEHANFPALSQALLTN